VPVSLFEQSLGIKEDVGVSVSPCFLRDSFPRHIEPLRLIGTLSLDRLPGWWKNQPLLMPRYSLPPLTSDVKPKAHIYNDLTWVRVVS
jgi:hypothetical protein